MSPPDADLVQRTLAGEREAFGLLVNRYRRTIFVLVVQRGCPLSEADDVAQEVFLRAYQNLHTLQDAAAFPRWLYGISAHVGADWARARKRMATEDGSLEDVGAAESGAVAEVEEEAERALRALAELPEEQRLVLTLRYLHGLSPKEIAERLGEPRGTVRSRLHHALLYVQQAFGCAPSSSGGAEAHKP